ncbi:MAG: serine/threonine protein kinase [Planctomycetota bacterium]
MSEIRANLIEGYTLEKIIGKGGMGVVLKAKQHSLDKFVAIKILAPKFADDAEYVKRFIREARTAAKLNHPNIMQVLDTGNVEKHYYIVMEYIEGVSLAKILKEKGKLDEKEALGIAAKVAEALGAAQKEGLVHRDIKPENIMITDAGHVKLCDMGLAKSTKGDAGLTQEGSFVGTPYYIAPEQAKGESVDIRSDIYALGMTVYHMLTGNRPFEGDTIKVLASQIDLDKRPRDIRLVEPSVSPATATVVKKAISKRRSYRYQTPEDFCYALKDALDSHDGKKPVSRPAGSRVGKTRRKPPRREARPESRHGEIPKTKSPLPYIAVIGGAVAILIIVVVLALSGGKDTPSDGPGENAAFNDETEAEDSSPPSMAGRQPPESRPEKRRPARADSRELNREQEERSIEKLRSQIGSLVRQEKFREAEQLLKMIKTDDKSSLYLEALVEQRDRIRDARKKKTESEIRTIEAAVSKGQLDSASRMAAELETRCPPAMKDRVSGLRKTIADAVEDKKRKDEAKRRAAALDPKKYSAALCRAAGEILAGDYKDALVKAGAGLPGEAKEILERQFDIAGKQLAELKKKTGSYTGKKLPIGFISGDSIKSNFIGMTGTNLAFDAEDSASLYPLALFEPSGILGLLSGSGKLARGVICLQNFWFKEAKREFQNAPAQEKTLCDFFVRLIDGHAAELAGACLTELQKPAAELCRKKKFIAAFKYQNSLEVLVERAECPELLQKTRSMMTEILAGIVRETADAAGRSKDLDLLAESYAAEMTEYAYKALVDGKKSVAMMALKKALSVNEDNPFATALMQRLEK